MKLKILVINWRSIKDPSAGGAEQVTFEHAKRWVLNHETEVTWLSPKYDKTIKHETIEGVNFEYVSPPLGLSVKNLMFTYPLFYVGVLTKCLLKYRNKIDVIIECIHGIPLLTNLYARKPVIAYLHEVAGSIWDKMFPFPINIIGRETEKHFLRTYKYNKFVVVSQCTKEDLISLGITSSNITIVNNGVKMPIYTGPRNKEDELTVLFLNRLVKMKGIERAIKIFQKLNKCIPESTFRVVGKYNPDYKSKLEDYAKKLNISDNIKFYGFVDEQKKQELLKTSHVLINTSHKEGWGLCNIEANRQGTPAVAFNVEGNRDSIVDGVNGFLVEDNDEEAMVEAILKAYRDKSLGERAKEYSKKFRWADKSKQFYKIIKNSYINE